MKQCRKCGKYKSVKDFHKAKNNKGGLSYICKECSKEYDKNYYLKNKEKHNKYSKNYYITHKERYAQLAKIWYNKNKSKIKKQHMLNRHKIIEYNKNYYLKNKRKESKRNKLYHKIHKKEINKRALRNWHKKFKTNLNFRILHNLRGRLRDALGKNCKSKKTIKLIGCSIKKLKEHIEKQFKPGMSWDNWCLYGWHIDHIKPCYMFDLNKAKEQEKCFNYKNLRPLWATENLTRNKNEIIRSI
jgi:hypothetical protein